MKTKTSHTPGPWYERREYNSLRHSTEVWFEVFGQSKHYVAQTGRDYQKQDGSLNPNSNDTEAQLLANAHLIASAPDMLEMLYRLLPCAEESDQFNKADRKLAPEVRALIAKATGENHV